MRIVEQSATLEHMTFDPVGVVTAAGATAYQSSPKDNEAFVRMLIRRGHDSVLEHAVASFRIVCDRGVSHEIVRHRMASYTQESTRYCRYKDGIVVVKPASQSFVAVHESIWSAAVEAAEKAYLEMLNAGATPQMARSVLPSCVKTELVMTANFREWRHFLRLRLAQDAHPQIREVAYLVLSIFRDVCPVFVEDLS